MKQTQETTIEEQRTHTHRDMMRYVNITGVCGFYRYIEK